MKLSPLTALSPLDGRYQNKVEALRPILSEYGLIRYRVIVEIKWLLFLSQEKTLTEIPSLNDSDIKKLEEIIDHFDLQAAEAVKTIEATTNHDVKAVEYYLQRQLEKEKNLAPLIGFIHFGCTSEDINNLSYSLMINEAREIALIPIIKNIGMRFQTLAEKYAELPLLSRTHGQPATPTTLGKELANIVARIHAQYHSLAHLKLLGKMNGAVGNFNAHQAAYPTFDWPTFSKRFIQSLGLEANEYTTQIEPHDRLSEFLQSLVRLNTILIDCCRDIWSYISLGYFFQKSKKNEVGSSTMPHKVNPIDFENAEGNLGLANALANHLINKLPISRWQRDLTDSTVMRNLGCIFGYALIAYESLLKGLDKISANEQRIREDLEAHSEVLAEALQTVMRRYGVPRAYEQLKELTRDKTIDKNRLTKFIEQLSLPTEAKNHLKSLTPSNYTGFAAELAKKISTFKWD
ncbi:adenylosuccinate lyase [Coxiella burnetii]|uniref:Adenylosuccinate lyase n=1 Tax=Coxiella burnetii (strain Dugway 5J108-111) TaxID=434922 RepID=A9KFH8_COXBN|nr:adenylosuccinate lyase [Coxiella burnetii]ABS77912.1 adenylosuccinate lyase [Coxiella burnetii Dugway 5J108-111]ACJ18511.1 adenylosuccinate lyase [Coxiella burnetii CbuG_Q212]ACJ19948.1 adenylosuccinate lyase [Coxiella burnetii CbuK_Q154]ATN66893.1 adenylosuccinate lyase [Coxiella burnetii]ATN85400.1 adenylosuccinate lyase [Coxiella burnetii str. Schperling]